MLPAVKMGRGGEERRVRGRERGKEEGYLHVSVGLLLGPSGGKALSQSSERSEKPLKEME